MAGTFNNILIIKPSSMGDVVLALPALSALRKSCPEARISWFIRPEFAPLLEGHPYLDELILFDRRFLGKAWYSPRSFSGLVSLVRTLRRGGYDAVFDFQGLFRTASLTWLSGSPRRTGPAETREPTGVFYTDKVPQRPETVHLVDYYLDMVRTSGIEVGQVDFTLGQDEEASKSAGRILDRYGVNRGNYVILVPGSMHADKCWPAERFARIADAIAAEFAASVVIVGGPSETRLAQTVQQHCGEPVTNLAGCTSLAELMVLLRTARLVISNDTGPGHIAAAWGTPVIMIFGRSNPARVAPYGRPENVAAIEPFERGLIIDSTDPRHHVNNVTFEQVYEKVHQQLGR